MSHSSAAEASASAPKGGKFRYSHFLLLVSGLGGLLYGVDVGIIGGALPYLEATSGLNANQLSIIVAAVLLGSVISTLFAGLLADWMGRRLLMTLSGISFVISIPIIALSHGYEPLFLGRLLQGVSGGLIGIVVPLYLAECLPASTRGKGTGIFQWLLTLGVVAAALIGIYYSYRVAAVEQTASAAKVFLLKDQAWRRIFWVSLPPGILFVIGSLFLSESPRWLFRKGRKQKAHAALLRSRTPEQANIEFQEMEEAASARTVAAISKGARKVKESLLQRKYILPFVLACVILILTQAVGTNSIIAFNTNILLESGLSDLGAHWGYVILTMVNFMLSIVGVMLVDRKGRKFLFMLGTAGMFVSLLFVGTLFLRAESIKVNCQAAIQAMVQPDQTLDMTFSPDQARKLLAAANATSGEIQSGRASLAIVYSYGDFTAATTVARSDEKGAAPIKITRANAVPHSKLEAFSKNPFANVKAAQTAPLRIQQAYINRVPSPQHGWLVAIGIYVFMGFFSLGPGVCVWLALTELMPTRIRSNGMSIALVLNQVASTAWAGIFLPTVSKYGYATVFYAFGGFAVIYFIVVTLFLPETKGKTLEEIEQHFERSSA